jgi:hypothetical protein
MEQRQNEQHAPDWMEQTVAGCRTELLTCDDPDLRAELEQVIRSYEGRGLPGMTVGLRTRLTYIARRLLGLGPSDIYTVLTKGPYAANYQKSGYMHRGVLRLP